MLLAVAAVFLALHALHLRADFPNHSPWMDWAKYTDEGWYGDAAIRHFQRGDWYVPGDFNPAAALPAWPVLESVIFHFTGVNVIAARGLAVAIFALILISVYLLVRRWQQLQWPDGSRSLAPAGAVLLLAVSPFCYAFSRMAILEPMLILLMLLTLLCISYAPVQSEVGSGNRGRNGRFLAIFTLGILLPLMVFTKTTAVFLLPAIAWLLFARCSYRLRAALEMVVPATVVGISLWALYYRMAVRPHFLEDYRYLFSANAYTGVTAQNMFEVLQQSFVDGLWLGQILYPLAIAATVFALVIRPRLLKNPLLPALFLWAAGYLAFIIYHNNLQPRYYLVIVVPVTLIAVIVLENALRALSWRSFAGASAAAACVAVLITMAVLDARQTLRYVLHPEYSFSAAAEQIRRIVDSDRTHSPLVLSISGSDLSLMTGLPSICDDFGTMDLSERVKAYHPGWYVAWNEVDDDKMDALTPLYRLRRVASFPAMDDPERNLMILYRLDPPPSVPTPHRPRHSATELVSTDFNNQDSPLGGKR
ncbi:ArnT family glycosyltransferase [Edaphobacter sp. HDX4]|uniref:ArnT family glycosyltransferase n=1 Tax=Edaphobacter sp. HDX4 TaxID=2794064 RepID=UPI002FE66B7D